MSDLNKKFDFLVFIGRFQPFHNAHKEVIDIAFSLSQHVILVLGSAQDERTIKNPFSITERQLMIRASFSDADQQYFHFVPIVDLYNDEKWVSAVKSGVNSTVDAIAKSPNKIGLIGHFKDESSYYLKLFPEWELVELENLKNALSATPLREKYYQGEIDTRFPRDVQTFLKEFQSSVWYPKLQAKYSDQDFGIISLDESE